jgi:signal peptidase II
MNLARRWGMVGLIAIFLMDQASKLWLLFGYGLERNPPLHMGSILEFAPSWNRGISFSLLQQHSDAGRWLLVAFMLSASIGLAVWMWRAASPVLAAGLGMIVGGALGNAVDRAAYGAVFDFIKMDLHFFVWPAIFNIADLAIVVGVGFLLYDSVMHTKAAAPETP